MDSSEKKRLFLSSISTIEEGVPLVLHDNIKDKTSSVNDNERNGNKLLMPPPSGKMQKKQRVIQKKVVLDEDEYIDTLSEIIEQKYYPNTREYKLQLALLEAQANNNFVESSIITDEINQYKLESNNNNNNNNNEQQQEQQLDTFFNNYTSEDNESFKQLHQKDLAAHRSRYHWAYESNDPNKKQGMLMLYHIDEKTVLSSSERNQMEKLLNSDNSNNHNQKLLIGPAAGKFQVRNSFMFPPDEEIINPDGTLGSSHGEMLRITDDDNKNSSKKVIVASNTRLNNTDDSLLLKKHHFSQVSPLEAPHTPSIYSTSDFSDTDSFASYPRNKNKEYKLIPMTPLHIVNGSNSKSTIQINNPLLYEMQPLSTRDNLIQNIETSCTKKLDKSNSSSAKNKKQLKPAAAMLAQKIKSNNNNNPFGGAFSN